MSPVAETDLEGLLDELDVKPEFPRPMALVRRVLSMTGCLIRAVDFLHEMRVVHGDIKPSNILVDRGMPALADFVISRLIAHDETTGTTHYAGGTMHYIAPETQVLGQRHGRTVDIFSRGCVLLEMTTSGWGGRKRFLEFRIRSTGAKAYCKNSTAITQWIWFLWAVRRKDGIMHDPIYSGLAFLMLDPDLTKRITARQLVAMISHPNKVWHQVVNNYACLECRLPAYVDTNIPLHSTFWPFADQHFPSTPEEALEIPVAKDWEDVKRKWLTSHIWWKDDVQAYLDR